MLDDSRTKAEAASTAARARGSTFESDPWLETAKDYLHGAVKNTRRPDSDCRLAKDKDLERFGIPNGFQSTKRGRVGPWYGDSETVRRASCRRHKTCVTEFGAQGLELDATLLAWGTDLVIRDGKWSNAVPVAT